jgi:hypothetical protein
MQAHPVLVRRPTRAADAFYASPPPSCGLTVWVLVSATGGFLHRFSIWRLKGRGSFTRALDRWGATSTMAFQTQTGWRTIANTQGAMGINVGDPVLVQVEGR